MSIRPIPAFLVASALVPASARADIVRFDAEAYCEEIAGFGGTYSSEMYNFCLESEQKAYNALKGRWNEIAPRIRAHCTEIASFGSPGSYEMLKFCIEQEEQAASSTPSFQY